MLITSSITMIKAGIDEFHHKNNKIDETEISIRKTGKGENKTVRL